ncbi:preprotein translocase subunit TatB [Allocatelliglobosispora scoriae]|uniref:preprotein translocase subunit TatB n=1 Tax=Allocatelliglobosispora scoriae TaxID=643052 RepID=UPI001620162E|nr:preprotein translocase subunit TatB [Allocatelliglobosispora scoriae]
MFENLNGWEFFALLLIALLIFGEKLPNAIADGMRMLRNLRNMARNATGDLSRELGTDISLEDLNPKTFMRKHLLSEEEEAALRKPLQGMFDDVRNDVRSIADDVKSTAGEFDPRKVSSTAPTTPEPPAVSGSRFVDAT